jgi:peptide/nickel transport system substrate-binding protein
VHDSETLYLRLRAPQFYPDRLRKAVNYAINREELWKYAAKGNAYNLAGDIPPGAYGHNPNLTLYTYDTEKARALLAEAGYPDGFEMKIITVEAWKLEAQIISKMLERIGIKVTLEAFPFPEYWKRVYIPIMDCSPEEQDWDIGIHFFPDVYGHTGTSLYTFYLTDESDFRWIEYDEVLEEMWKDMANTVDTESQEQKIRDMVQYVYNKAYRLYIYTPLTLYAINKEVNYIAQKTQFLRFKEASVTDSHWSIRGENQ